MLSSGPVKPSNGALWGLILAAGDGTRLRRYARKIRTMVFKVKTLFDLFRILLPGIYFNFHRVFEANGTPAEQTAVNALYEFLEPVNFSKAIMEQVAARFPEQLAVLGVRDVVWSDWGSEERIRQTISKLQSSAGAKPRPRQDPSTTWRLAGADRRPA